MLEEIFLTIYTVVLSCFVFLCSSLLPSFGKSKNHTPSNSFFLSQ